MVLPRVKTDLVEQGDSHTDLEHPAPGSEEKHRPTWPLAITGQKDTITVSRCVVWYGRERERDRMLVSCGQRYI